MEKDNVLHSYWYMFKAFHVRNARPPGGLNWRRRLHRLHFHSHAYGAVTFTFTLTCLKHSRCIHLPSLFQIGPAVWPTIRNIHRYTD